MRKTILLTFIATLFLASCASVSYTVLQDYTPKNNPSDKIIDVYYTKKPEKPYKEVCQMTTNTSSETESMKLLKEKAKELGLDGIIMLGNFQHTSTSSNFALGTTYTATSGGVRAVGIIYE